MQRIHDEQSIEILNRDKTKITDLFFPFAAGSNMAYCGTVTANLLQ